MVFLWVSLGLLGLHLGQKKSKIKPNAMDYVWATILGPILLVLILYVNIGLE